MRSALGKPISMRTGPQSKTHFDFIDAASKAYAFAWHRKKTLIYLAIVPVVIKFATMLIIMFFEVQDQYLRQGLLLLPSYFAEGWLAAQTMRLLLITDSNILSSPWPKQRFVKNSPEENRNNLLSAIILYTLVMLLSSMFVGLSLQSGVIASPDASPSEPNGFLSLLALFSIAFVIWAFRFIWLYVAVGLGYRIKDFVRSLMPFYISIYMIGTWLICIVPIGLVMMMASEAIMGGSNPADAAPGAGYFVALYLLRSVFEALLAIVTTTAMAVAITAMIEGPDRVK